MCYMNYVKKTKVANNKCLDSPTTNDRYPTTEKTSDSIAIEFVIYILGEVQRLVFTSLHIRSA